MKPPAISAIQEIELNIAPGTEIDPWPRYGLAAKYKPFILNRVKPFLQNNGHLNRNEVITDAIRITWEASQKFKQELGYDFSTYLRHLLPNRLYDLYGIEKSKKDEETGHPQDRAPAIPRRREWCSAGSRHRRSECRRQGDRQ